MERVVTRDIGAKLRNIPANSGGVKKVTTGGGGAGDFLFFVTTSTLFEASKLLEPQLQSFYCSDHKSK